MKISYQWLQELVSCSGFPSATEVAQILTSRGLEVEEIHFQGKGLEKVITAEIVEKGMHPNSDRLSLCKIRTNETSNDLLSVVCGATNHQSGDRIALAQVGAVLPGGMEIGESKIRGTVSQGMLCSESELNLPESFGKTDGILILSKDTPLGVNIADLLGLKDYIFTLKLYANQGHLQNHRGVALELIAALNLKTPGSAVLTAIEKNNSKWDSLDAKFLGDGAGTSAVCPMFSLVKISNIPEKRVTPQKISRRLEALGQRSIDPLVDVTNYVLLELGHPTHAYDASTFIGKSEGFAVKAVSELGKSAAELALLDGSTIKLHNDDLVIADLAERPLGLAGVMGGADTQIQSATHTVFLECAAFDSTVVRKMKVRHQKFSEAALRFEKGVPITDADEVCRRIAFLLSSWTNTNLRFESISKVWKSVDAKESSIEFSHQRANTLLGLKLTQKEIEAVFTSLSLPFKGSAVGGDFVWHVQVPSDRRDLKISEDLVEELARSLGYDKIPSRIPSLSSAPLRSNLSRPTLWRDRVRTQCSFQGYQEAIHYGFTSPKLLEQTGFTATIRLQNPLSEDLSCMVPSLVPNLLNTIRSNDSKHFGSEIPAIRLFELRPVFRMRAAGEPTALNALETNVEETFSLGLVSRANRFRSDFKAQVNEMDFRDFHGEVSGLLEGLKLSGLKASSDDGSKNAELPHWLHPGRSVVWKAAGPKGLRTVGFSGRLHPKLGQALGLKGEVFVAEWNLELLLESSTFYKPGKFKNFSEFPGIERDFAFVLPKSVTAESLRAEVKKAAQPLASEFEIFDVYEGPGIPDGSRSIAIRVQFQKPDRSIQEPELEPFLTKIKDQVRQKLGGQLRS